MGNWAKTEVNFGSSRENTVLKLEFKLNPDAPLPINFVGSCGCTNFVFNKDTRILSVKLSINRIPPQVQGIMPVSKIITAYYEDETTEMLYIKGIVHR